MAAAQGLLPTLLRPLSLQSSFVVVHNTFLHCFDPPSCGHDEDGDLAQPGLLRSHTAPVRSSASEPGCVVEERDMEELGSPYRPHLVLHRIRTPDPLESAIPWSAGEDDDDQEIGGGQAKRDPFASASTSCSGGQHPHSLADRSFPPHNALGTLSLATGRIAVSLASATGVDCSPAHGDHAADATVKQERTTVMLRNLPNNYTRTDVMDLIDSKGFAGRYDFLYIPIDFRTRAALGYAFLNLISSEDAERFRTIMDGFSDWNLSSMKVCSVSWSNPHQGLDSHIARYRNSPLMHEDVPDEYRPVLFADGKRISFPPPTKKIKPPRQGTQRMLV